MDIAIPVASTVSLPKVSVIIGNYNQGRFAADAIRSVAAQTYADFGCVVVDDRSTDDSARLIETALAELNDERFRFIARETNGGQMAAMLTGLDVTDAPFVAFVDADDVWHPEFLEHHVSAHLSRAGNAAISSSNLALVNESGALVASDFPMMETWRGNERHTVPKYMRFEGKDENTRVFVDRRAVGWLWGFTSAMVFRRETLVALRPKSVEAVRIQADSYWANGAHMLGGTVRLLRCLGYYRIHKNNSWANSGFFGADSVIGVENEEVAASIRAELIRTYCAAAPRLEHVIEKKHMARALANHLGWDEALKLHDRDEDARDLLSGWATPKRRIVTRLARILPKKLRPADIRISDKRQRIDSRKSPPPTASQAPTYTKSVYGPYLVDTPGDRTFELCVTGYGDLVSGALARQDRDFVFIDIGANCGVFSLLAAEHPSCKEVIAIEPVPQTFDRLKSNIAHNKAGKVRPVRAAISDNGRSRVRLTFNPRHSGMASITEAKGKNTVEAPVLDANTLSELVGSRQLPIVVKIDVEGSETAVLKALRETRFFSSISDMFIEISERHSGADGVRSILQFLEDEGFEEVHREGPSEHYDAHWRRIAPADRSLATRPAA